MSIYYQDERVTLHHGDCLDVLRTLPDSSVDAVVTDPPYGLEFMGKDWDAPWQRADVNADAGFSAWTSKGFKALPSFTGSTNPKCSRCKGTRRGRRDGTAERPVCLCDDGGRFPNTRAVEMRAFGAWCTEWAAECLRVLKPGGHLLAFGGTRTWHRLACAVEDAGFEVRDSLAWVYGSGFPKSLNVRKSLGDRACRCDEVESTHDEAAEPQAEHSVRGVRGGDVPEAVRVDGGPGSVLLPSVPESGAPSHGTAPGVGSDDGAEPGMEGRRDLQAPEGELRGSALRALPVGVPGDGEGRRLRDGAPSRDGSSAGPVPAAVGGGESHQPRPEGQPAGESGAVPVERGSQAGRGWPVCGRCGKPSVPDGLGTALKPAFEPVVVARKPLAGTVAANVLAHGTGALNIDGCRLPTDEPLAAHHGTNGAAGVTYGARREYVPGSANAQNTHTKGRWPANVILDESQAVALDEQTGTLTSGKMHPTHTTAGVEGRASAYGKDAAGGFTTMETYGDSGGASRFFYVAKAPKRERPVVDGVAHPTVKPLALMRWLVRLVTPPGGVVLEPFAGSGTTVEACIQEGVRCIAIEKGDEYLPLILERIRRSDPDRVADEVVRTVDVDAAIAEQVAHDEPWLFELDGEGG